MSASLLHASCEIDCRNGLEFTSGHRSPSFSSVLGSPFSFEVRNRFLDIVRCLSHLFTTDTELLSSEKGRERRGDTLTQFLLDLSLLLDFYGHQKATRIEKHMPPSIEVIERHVVWENPTPTFTSRHAFFPGLVKLPSGELLAMFRIGQAIDSSDQVVYVSRSSDNGYTWTEPIPLHEDYRPGGLGSMKPTLLDDGSLVAVGYMHYAEGNRWLNLETGGCPEGLNLISYSKDEGQTWSLPTELLHRYPEVLETSGPCIKLQSGDLIALGTPVPIHDGTRPSGTIGIAMRSTDRGQTWNDSIVFFRQPPISPLEARLSQLDDGRIVAIVWALNESSGVCCNNMITVSHDDGYTWSQPADTGIAAQASNVLAGPGNQLLSIHAHREQSPVEMNVWNRTIAQGVSGYADMGTNIKFGQPSLLHVIDDEYLAYHWAIEDGQGKILAHRLRIGL